MARSGLGAVLCAWAAARPGSRKALPALVPQTASWQMALARLRGAGTASQTALARLRGAGAASQTALARLPQGAPAWRVVWVGLPPAALASKAAWLAPEPGRVRLLWAFGAQMPRLAEPSRHSPATPAIGSSCKRRRRAPSPPDTSCWQRLTEPSRRCAKRYRNLSTSITADRRCD